MSEEQLLLIVIAPWVKEQLRKKGWFDEMKNELRALDAVRLYNFPEKKGATKTDIALPLKDGKTLHLEKYDGDDMNCFQCKGVYEFRSPSTNLSYCHELQGDVKVWIVDHAQVSMYLRDAIDCDKIDRDVKTKLPWKPFESNDSEMDKWHAYLKLFKDMLNDQRFGLSVEYKERAGNLVKLDLDFSILTDVGDDEIRKKINDTRGETVHFALTADTGATPGSRYTKEVLGKLRSFSNTVEIELDEDFPDLLRRQIKAGGFYTRSVASKQSTIKGAGCPGNKREMLAVFLIKKYVDDINSELKDTSEDKSESANHPDSKQPESGGADSAFSPGTNEALPFEFSKADGQQQTDFYYEESCENKVFSCLAVQEKFGWKIDPDSIKPHCLMLFADFIGDFYQIEVMKRGLKKIQAEPIWQVLSGDRVAKLPEDVDVEWSDDCRLNDRQKSAVKKALGTKELCLIWGPPGTGKTEVIAEIARQEAMRDKKTLIASQANLAVDNALERLHSASEAWTFRVAKDKYKLEKEDEKKVPVMETADKFFSEWLQNRLDMAIQLSSDSDENKKLREQLYKRLQKPARSERQKAQMAELYRDRINIVGATLMMTGKSKWDKDPKTDKKNWESERNKLRSDLNIADKFDTVIVDEVSKAMPPELFLPILQGKRVVLVGDHKQLPPMIKLISGDDVSLEDWAKEAKVHKDELDLETTIFERLWKRHGSDASSVREMLTTQYRMHPDIQDLIQQFYQDNEGELKCGIPEEEILDMPIASRGMFSHPAVWVDTDHDAYESRDGTSFINGDEIRIVGKILDALPRGLSIGVITFYGAQLRRLRKYEEHFASKFPDGKLIFGTVDRFHGRECDVVICSLVRNNRKNTIGFARKLNRINVAFSRARKMLCIVGNIGQFCYESDKMEAQKEACMAYRRARSKSNRFSERDVEKERA